MSLVYLCPHFMIFNLLVITNSVVICRRPKFISQKVSDIGHPARRLCRLEVCATIVCATIAL